ncbi:hypothetical protein ABPG77_002035 [Micractinium sp. CCAP 211/92]
MRPKAQQKPWQRRAVQYGLYAIWPLLLLWLISSYPGSGGGGRVTRHTTAADLLGDGELLHSASRDTKVAVDGGADEGDGSGQQHHMGGADLADLSSEGEPDGVVDADAGSTLEEQQQQLEVVGGLGADADAAAAAAGGDGEAGDPLGQPQQRSPVPPPPPYDPNRIYSSATIYAVRNGNGAFSKFYYKFKNVRLTKKFLYFHMPPGMKRPTEHWVDFISGNATEPRLPSMIVIKGEVQRQKWYYLPVKYTTAPLSCSAWTKKPTYFLQVRYSYNIWHTWNEGLMGAFQTLREQGLLPLAQVDEQGNMREVTEGLSSECPTIWDEVLNGTRPEDECAQRLGVVKGTRCDFKTQPWCRPGVVSYRRFDGPIILPYTAASVMNRWAQVYDAMTTDIRDLSLADGHCFKNLIVGKTNTLNYYQPMNFTANTTVHIRERVESMAVFKQFVSTAQREFVAAEKRKNPAAAEFRGYSNPKMEVLRKGIGPEDIDKVEYIAPGEVPGLLREELPQLKEMWAKRRKEIARIEAAWKAGKIVVKDDEEGQDASAGGDDDSSEGNDEGRADRRRSLLEPRTALGGSSSGGSSSSSGGDGLAFPGGEGARRRMPHRAARALLQEQDVDGTAARAAEQQQQQQQEETEGESREQVLKRMPSILKRSDEFQLESPRPVVTYMSRNFFSRGVLNEHDVLRYILAKYNVTLRVTTFEEPLLESMELLQHTDVMIGMHGAGWTNGMFIKHGAVTLQMFPYGWRLPDNSTIRGYNYREIVLASECGYAEWVSQRWDYAFFRRIDFNRRVKMEYVLHPDPHGPHPVDGWPGNPWVYQNTYVDMEHFGPYIDAAMKAAGIPPVPNPIPVTLNR